VPRRRRFREAAAEWRVLGLTLRLERIKRDSDAVALEWQQVRRSEASSMFRPLSEGEYRDDTDSKASLSLAGSECISQKRGQGAPVVHCGFAPPAAAVNL
jgi:hypothetical protein